MNLALDFVFLVFVGGILKTSAFILHAELYDDPGSDVESKLDGQSQAGPLIAQNRPKRQVQVISRNPHQTPPFQIPQQTDQRYWQGVPQPVAYGQASQVNKDNYWNGAAQPVIFPNPGYPPKIGTVNGAKEAYVYQAFAAPQLQPQFGAPFGNPQWQPVPNFGG